MNEFFKSAHFKVLAALFVLLFSFMLHAATDNTAAPFLSKVVGLVISPLQGLSTSVSEGVGGFFDTIFRAGRIRDENEQLKEDIRRLRDQLLEYEVTKQENEFLREFINIKEENADMTMVHAKVVGRESQTRFYSFTIDKGSASGISYRDPVISPDGLVGVVTEVGINYSKVTTVLDTSLNVGCIDIAVRETGVTTGTVQLAEEGLIKLSYLPRDSVAAPGDIVMTTGVGGFFPPDIRVGSILEVRPEEHGLSLYAVIKPAADVRHVRDVMVITGFAGKGETAENSITGGSDELGSDNTTSESSTDTSSAADTTSSGAVNP